MIEPLVGENIYVRLTGWLLFDSSGIRWTGQFRASPWEIHPITAIDVCTTVATRCSGGNGWVPLDQYHPRESDERTGEPPSPVEHGLGVTPQPKADRIRRVDEKHKSWLPVLTGVIGTLVAYAIATAALLVLASRRGTKIFSRNWLVKLATKPLLKTPFLGRRLLFIGYKRRLLNLADVRRASTSYFGLPATCPDSSSVLPDVDGAGFDVASGNAFASNADGTLTVIHQDTPDEYHVVESVQTPQGSRNMGLDPTNHRVFLVSAKFGEGPAGGRKPVLPGTFTLMVIERGPATH